MTDQFAHIEEVVQGASLYMVSELIDDDVVMSFALVTIHHGDGMMSGDSSISMRDDVDEDVGYRHLLTALRGVVTELERELDVEHMCPPPNN